MRALVFSAALFIAQSSFAATLFYLKQELRGCHANTLELPNKKLTTLFTVPECPSQIVWTGGKTLYVSENQLWEIGADKKSKSLARLPWPVQSFWIEKSTQHPRIGYLVLVDEKNIVEKGTGEKKKTFYRFENQLLDATDLVDFGSPNIAITAELQNGKWKRLEMKATKSEAGDTPHLTVLESFNKRAEEGTSLAALLSSTTCAGGKLNCEIDNPRIKKLVGKLEGYGSTDPLGKSQFVFNVVFGDSAHAASPVFFCKDKCVKLKEVKSEQLAIARADGLVLVANEYTNDNPQVYSETTGTKLFELKEAQSAAWLPTQLHRRNDE